MTHELMRDKSQPDLRSEDGTAMNIMTRNDMRRVIVKVTFIPKLAKLPPVRPRRMEFPTTVAATEFIETIKPPPGKQIGSPKQFRAKIARILRLDNPSIVSKYEIHTEYEVGRGAAVGQDTGVVEPTPDEPLDTFVPGTEIETPEPVDAEAILNAADAGLGNDTEFPE